MEVFFSNIENFLVEKINHATTSINVAVAWFTNQTLLEELIKAVERKVEVNVIILNDIINRNELALDFNPLIEKGGHLFLSSEEKIMHNKFCIIDSKEIITGSYNWTYYAENRNWENIISTDNISAVKDYKDEFERIKALLKETKNYEHVKLTETKSETVLDNYDYIYIDTHYKEVKVDVELTNYLVSIKNNLIIQQKEAKYIPPQPVIIKPIVLRTRASLGIEVNDELGEGTTMCFMIKSGTPFPCQVTQNFFSIRDGQTSVACKTYIGESKNVTDNHLIGTILLDDFPPLPKGEAIMEVTFDLSVTKKLHVVAKNKNIGTIKESVYNLYDYII